MNNNINATKYSNDTQRKHNKDNSIKHKSQLNHNHNPLPSKEPIMVMTLEFEKGKVKKLIVYSESDPSELAFDFCKEHNLDFASMKYLISEISLLITKYKSNQLDISRHELESSDSIEEVDNEEVNHSNNTQYNKENKNKSIKGSSNGNKNEGGFIYGSIDSGHMNSNSNCNEHKEEEVEEELADKGSNKDICGVSDNNGYEYSKEHFTNTSMNNVMKIIQINKEDSKENLNSKEKKENEIIQNRIKDDSNNEDNQDIAQSKEESGKDEGEIRNEEVIHMHMHDKTDQQLISKPIPYINSELNAFPNNSQKSKAKSDTSLTHIGSKSTNKNKASDSQAVQCLDNDNDKDNHEQEKKIILNERDYNYPDTANEKSSTKHKYELIKTTNINIISQPRQFSALTKQTTTNSYYISSAINHTENTRNNYLTETTQINYSLNKNYNGKGSFLDKEEQNRNSSSSFTNVFQKLFEDAELKRKLFKRPCHFSSRLNNYKSTSKQNSNNNNSLKKISPLGNKRLDTHQSSFNQTHASSSFHPNNINRTEASRNTHNLTSLQKKQQSNGKGKNHNHCLSKDNLFNPYLTKRQKQIKADTDLKYSFYPQINHNYDFEPGLSFLERQSIYEEVHQNNTRNIVDLTHKSHRNNKNNKQIHIRDYNVFRKNYDFAPKYKTKRSDLYNQYQSNVIEPFKCTNESNEIFNKKKKEAFSNLFKQLDNDEDGMITAINISTKTIPSDILLLIDPLIDSIRNGIYAFDKNNFIKAIDEIYSRMDLRDKRTLLEYYSNRKRNRNNSKWNIHKEEDLFKRNKSFNDNKTHQLAENNDKRVSLSFSQNNIILNNPTVIQHKAYFRPKRIEANVYNYIRPKSNLSIQQYTFDSYKNNLSYNY